MIKKGVILSIGLIFAVFMCYFIAGCGGGGGVGPITSPGDPIIDIPSATPSPTAQASEKYCYVANQGSDDISKINLATRQIEATIVAGDGVTQLALNNNNSRLYATNMNANTISVIDTALNVEISSAITFLVGGSPDGIALNANNTNAYVCLSSDNIVGILDLTTDLMTPPGINVGNAPAGIVVLSNGTAYTANIDDDTVSVINTSNGALITTVNVGDGPSRLAVSLNEDYIYVAHGRIGSSTHDIRVIKVSNNQVVQTIAHAQITSPSNMAINSDGTRCYVSNSNGNTLVVLDSTNKENNTYLSTINVGNKPMQPAITPDGQYLYVPNKDDGTVSVIKTSDNSITATITVGTQPVGCVMDH